MAEKLLNPFSFYHLEQFTTPYLVRKQIEGVEFIFSIEDRDARLWYDLYCTDPVWNEMRFIRDHLLSKGAIVLEAGSHHGCTAILLAHWVGLDGHVYAFEPGSQNFNILKGNVELNHIPNITCLPLAVGAENGIVDFIESRNSSMGSHIAQSSVNST